MWKRISQSALLPILAAIGVAGCYTQMRAPAGALDPYDRDGIYDPYGDAYWSDPYYDYLPYASWWEMYPGLPWWYADYHRPWPHHPHGHHDDWNTYEEVRGRHGWDRGPGSPLPPRVGGSLGGGVGGSVTPTTPPAQTAEEDDKDDSKSNPPDRGPERRPKDSDEPKRRGWGR
jgi:hypothetical protein